MDQKDLSKILADVEEEVTKQPTNTLPDALHDLVETTVELGDAGLIIVADMLNSQLSKAASWLRKRSERKSNNE